MGNKEEISHFAELLCNMGTSVVGIHRNNFDSARYIPMS